MDSLMRQRKYTLTWAIFTASCLFLWFGKLDGGGWITLCTLILGIYAGANVWEKRDAQSPG